jgi:hypothetical protein
LQAIAGCARGLSNKEIADELGLSEDTVKTHLRRAMMSIGARDRAHAVAIAMQSGWLGDLRPADPDWRPNLTKILDCLGATVELVLINGELVICQLVAILPDGVAVVTRPRGERRRYRDGDVRTLTKINDGDDSR